MARYRIEYEIKEDFGESPKMVAVIECPKDKAESEVLADFLAGFKGQLITSLSVKREV